MACGYLPRTHNPLMKLTIGVDFDNTIACYDSAFSVVAHEIGLTDFPILLSKAQIKARVLASPGGDLDWQRLQGQVYGKYIHLAIVYAGFVEFLRCSKLNGHSVFIVSQKSEFGHFDITRVNLRDAALRWLAHNGIVGSEGSPLLKSEVFFESTRREKLARIRALGCTHFIDDLKDVLADPLFPEWTERILFSPDCSVKYECGLRIEASWPGLETCIFGASCLEDPGSKPQSGIA